MVSFSRILDQLGPEAVYILSLEDYYGDSFAQMTSPLQSHLNVFIQDLNILVGTQYMLEPCLRSHIS
jgi:hypothetical protein